MLPQNYRITKKKDFENIFQEGKTIRGSFYFAKIKTTTLPFPRFAFVVPVKLEKKAVKRNRIRRVFREAVRSLLPLVKEKVDIIFVIKPKEELTFEKTQREVKEFLEKEKII